MFLMWPTGTGVVFALNSALRTQNPGLFLVPSTDLRLFRMKLCQLLGGRNRNKLSRQVPRTHPLQTRITAPCRQQINRGRPPGGLFVSVMPFAFHRCLFRTGSTPAHHHERQPNDPHSAFSYHFHDLPSPLPPLPEGEGKLKMILFKTAFPRLPAPSPLP